MLKYSTTVFVACALLLTGCLAQDAKKRPAVVAGSFYPSDAGLLSRMVDDSLAAASVDNSLGEIIGLVVPHAGYVYSGQVAAAGFVQLRGKKIDRVIVLAPSHVERLAPGAVIYDGDYYQTPLGDVPVDTAFARRLAAVNPRFRLTGAGHDTRTEDGRGEHAIEVQLPFLQRVLGSFKIVPIIIGDQTYESCRSLGVALASLIDGPDTVLIASSDLAHFHSYSETVATDKRLLAAVSEGDYLGVVRNLERGVWEACGGGPIVATMIAAERVGGGQARILKQANSGDLPGSDRTRVVGYASVAFVKNPVMPAREYSLGKPEQDRLLEIARKSVEIAVKEHQLAPSSDGGLAALAQERGAFVTLTNKGRLRGCIGYVAPLKPLHETVRDVAGYAAISDERFLPVAVSELEGIEYEISVLSPVRRVKDINEIEVGKHGLLIRKGSREGLLLPQVATESQWDRLTFLQQTCEKGRMAPDAWKDPEADVFCFTAFVFGKDKGQ